MFEIIGQAVLFPAIYPNSAKMVCTQHDARCRADAYVEHHRPPPPFGSLVRGQRGRWWQVRVGQLPLCLRVLLLPTWCCPFHAGTEGCWIVAQDCAVMW